MTKPETALSAVVERTFPLSEFGDDLHDYLQRGLRDVLYADLTALISEGYYPKEFVVWKDANCTYLRGNGRYAINDYPKTDYGDYVPYTIDELLEHWKTNEQ